MSLVHLARRQRIDRAVIESTATCSTKQHHEQSLQLLKKEQRKIKSSKSLCLMNNINSIVYFTSEFQGDSKKRELKKMKISRGFKKKKKKIL